MIESIQRCPLCSSEVTVGAKTAHYYIPLDRVAIEREAYKKGFIDGGLSKTESAKDIDDYIKKAKLHVENMTKQEARDFLVKIGINNADGTLTKDYGGE